MLCPVRPALPWLAPAFCAPVLHRCADSAAPRPALPPARHPRCRRWLQDQLPPEVRQRCYFFNTFFFKKLTEKEGERGLALLPVCRAVCRAVAALRFAALSTVLPTLRCGGLPSLLPCSLHCSCPAQAAR